MLLRILNGGGAVYQTEHRTFVKKAIHPESYRPVVFQDTAAGFSFLTRSTVKSNEKVVWEDGKEYPLFRLEISSHSHPFFTGQQKLVDSAGRVDKFIKKYGWKPTKS